MLIDRYLVPKFGKLPINAIQPQAIEAHFAELRRTKAPATVDKVRVIFHRSYVLAAKWGCLAPSETPWRLFQGHAMKTSVRCS
jgi:hypothetical protein